MKKRLSICVPVFNYPISGLAEDLVRQSDSEVEILFLDDGSEAEWKAKNTAAADGISSDQFRYEELEQNVGRQQIRMELHRRASTEKLVFLDGDVRIPDSNFVAKYLEKIDFDGVVVGGRLYPEKAPIDCEIHHKYGWEVETVSASKRTAQTQPCFQSNNFMVSKSDFLKMQPKIQLDGYGHEDTLMGFELEQNGISLLHIGNPVLHEGLDSNLDFLNKTEQGILNLIRIYNSPFYKQQAEQHIRLVQKAQHYPRFTQFLASSRIQALLKARVMRYKRLVYLQLWKWSLFAASTSGSSEA